MKVLHVISGVGKAQGGTAEVIPKICEVQQQHGISVMLATLEMGEISDSAKSAKRAGVIFRQFRAPFLKFNRVLLSFSMMVGLGRLVKDVDIVHIHGAWLFPVWWAARCARKFGRPYIMMPHGSVEPERLKISALKKKIVGRLFDRWVYQYANSIWVTAESEKVGVRQYGVTAPISVIPLGLETEKYEKAVKDSELINRLGLDVGRNIVLFFSRITRFKGLDLLAEAWADVQTKYPDWQLAIVGPDDFHGYQKEAERIFSSCCMKGSYVFTGPVYGEEKYKVLRSASLFILPTRNENFSIAVQEALATGVPVVCTKGAPWAELEEYHCGRWVEIAAPAIASALAELMAKPAAERVNMGRQGQRLVRERYSWRAIGDKMISAYQEVAS